MKKLRLILLLLLCLSLAALLFLRWQAKEAMLAAIGDAVAEKDDMKISGDRIESTDGFNKIKVIGKAHLVKGGTSE